MSYSKKKILHLGILAFAPIFLFALWLVYYFVILKDYIVQFRLEDHRAIQTTSVEYYLPLFLLLATNFIIAFIAFLYFVWDVWQNKEMPHGQRVVWVIFMAAFNIVAFPIYWYRRIKYGHVKRDVVSPALS